MPIIISTEPDGTTFVLTEVALADKRAVLKDGIKTFNNRTKEEFRLARQPEHAPQPLDVYLHDAAGELIGGLSGETIWGWLRIHDLWLPEKLRGLGFGSRLLQAAEEAASERGCHAVQLKTYSFQARGFYEKMGYRVVGEMTDYPPGESFYWMRKDFD